MEHRNPAPLQPRSQRAGAGRTTVALHSASAPLEGVKITGPMPTLRSASVGRKGEQVAPLGCTGARYRRGDALQTWNSTESGLQWPELAELQNYTAKRRKHS